MDKNKLKGLIASELIIIAMDTKGRRPTQLNFEEMVDVVADVVNKVSAYPMLAGGTPLQECYKTGETCKYGCCGLCKESC